MEGKVAVLGDADFVMPFSAMGLDTFAVEGHRDPEGERMRLGTQQQDARLIETAEQIAGANYALVVVAENIAPMVEDVFAAVRDKAVPCVIVVPFTTEPEGFAVRSLGRSLKIATGIDIL